MQLALLPWAKTVLSCAATTGWVSLSNFGFVVKKPIHPEIYNHVLLSALSEIKMILGLLC